MGTLAKLSVKKIDENSFCGEVPSQMSSLFVGGKSDFEFYYSNSGLGTPCAGSPTMAPTRSFAPTAAFTGNATQNSALSALYVATGGSSWSDKSGWMTGDPCTASWDNVNCDAGRVTELSLDDNQVSGSLPTQFGLLTDLTLLSMQSNQLSSALPTEIGALSRLETM